jgi:FkbM family methyltransferase
MVGSNRPLPVPRKVIYDFGSNNGDDVPYYLKKADVVVAVEADPALAQVIRDRFAEQIAGGSLFVENCVLAETGSPPVVPFYVHRERPFLSQFPRPGDRAIGDFDELLLPAKTPLQLVQAHGAPFYIKIDVEHYDAVILRELFLNGIRPPYISAESHSIDVFCWLVSMGGYRSFNLVNGPTVQLDYANHAIGTKDSKESYSFPAHSAGPFGADIRGPWMTPNNFFKVLALRRLGWKDIHATSLIEPDRTFPSSLHLRGFRSG